MIRVSHRTPNRMTPAALVRCALLVAPLWLIGASGCEKAPAPPAPAPTPVTVYRPLVREVVEWDEYTGHLSSPEYVEVRARVSGMIVDAPLKEGAIVKKGDLLFSIDVSPFQADLDARQADVARAKAQLGLANIQLERTAQELKSNAIAKSEYDNAAATVKQAQAGVAAASAAAEVSQLNVQWCKVVAPITGRVGQKIVTSGNLITGGTGSSTLLTTITSIDPMYCYVQVDERSILKYQKLAKEKTRVSARNQPIPCFLELANETQFLHEGVVDFVDNKLDPSTGTLQARGVYPNGDGELTPGFFARVRVAGSGKYMAILVPDSAIGTDQSVKFLLLADKDDKVERRPIQPGALFGEMRAVTSGLKEDERVVVDGLLRIAPGMKIAPEEKPTPPNLFQPMVPAGAATSQPTTGPHTLPASVPSGVAPATATSPADNEGASK